MIVMSRERLYLEVLSALLVVSIIQFLFSLHIAEFLYPGYSVSRNYISDLGATCRAGLCVVIQPSSTIFNLSVSLLGLLLVVSSYLLYISLRDRILASLLLVAGIGAVGVGLFPETYGYIHTVFSAIAFLPASVLPIAGIRVLRELWQRALSVVLGLLSVASLVLFVLKIDMGLGVGGVERMIVYPVLFWGLFFSGFLASLSRCPQARV